MATQRIYVIWTHPLFREATRLLLKHPEIEWLGATSNMTIAQDEIQSLLPDTILIEETSGDISYEIFEFLENYPGKVRIISLNLNDNKFDIYNHEKREADKSDDLLRSILHDSE